MPVISYHASHEQFAPSALLSYAQLAEQCGFDACHSSDHFHPWSARQGHSGFSFAWLGAAMQATRFPFSLITAPGQRFHPAIVAQAIATLTEMFPRRLEIALGSGEAINEQITGDQWPSKPDRNARLLECSQVIRRLLKGEVVNHTGWVKVQEAFLYTRPSYTPPLMCAALSEETARWAGTWADGLLTVHQEKDQLRSVIAAFEENGGKGKPIHVQMAVSYARDEMAALGGAHHQWRSNLLDVTDLADLSSVAEFDRKSESITMEDVKAKLLISSEPDYFISLIKQDLDLGAQNVILHNVNREQETFIKDFGELVLPALR